MVLVSNDNDPMYGSGRSVTEQDHSALEVIDYNQVSFVETNIKKKKFKNKIWGFFDGKDIYISSLNYSMASRRTRFSKILHYGKISYFLAAVEVREKTSRFVGGFTGFVPVRCYYILNMDNGRTYKLSAVIVEELIKDDVELLGKFQNDDHSKYTLLKYIRGFNSRNNKNGFMMD